MHLLHLLLSSTATLLRETVLARLSMPEFITPGRSFKSEDFVYTTFIVPLYPLQDFDYITMKLENTDSRLQEILRLLLQLQLFHTLSLFPLFGGREMTPRYTIPTHITLHMSQRSQDISRDFYQLQLQFYNVRTLPENGVVPATLTPGYFGDSFWGCDFMATCFCKLSGIQYHRQANKK